MYFVKVTTQEQGIKGFVFSFKTEEEAMNFRLMSEEDGTYWGMYSDPNINDAPPLYQTIYK